MELPSDMMFEILSRSSITSLGKCRLLSKDCNALTYGSTFMNLHCKRTKTVSGYILQSMRSNLCSSTFASIDNPSSNSSNSPLSLKFLPAGVKIEASTTQGLLLCVDYRTVTPKYYVCKPTTQEFQIIRNPKSRYSTVNFGMVVLKSNPLHYKIVKFSIPKYSFAHHEYKYNYLRCEVFDSTTNAWKKLEEIKLPYDEHFSFMPTVSAYGSLHWITNKNNIFSFHPNDDSYCKFPILDDIGMVDKHIRLTEFEGKLAVICMRSNQPLVEFWVMEKYEKNVWSKRITIIIESLRGKKDYSYPLAFYNADILLMKGIYEVTFVNLKNGSSETVKLEEHIYNSASGIFPFKSDFIPCNLKNRFNGSRRRRERNQILPSIMQKCSTLQ